MLNTKKAAELIEFGGFFMQSYLFIDHGKASRRCSSRVVT
jgi:hypothetical protein